MGITSGWRRLVRRARLAFIDLYPPFFGAGIRVTVEEVDPPIYSVRMPLRWFNRNYVGTHFGGSLYAMCDPFFMLILIQALGPGWTVWDKSATIRFRRPGRGLVRARFAIPSEEVARIAAQARDDGRCEPVFTVDVVDESGAVVAQVEKRLWVRPPSGATSATSPTPEAPA